MTFDEYRKRRDNATPRSIAVTISFSLLSIIGAIGCAVMIKSLIDTGFNAAVLIILAMLALVTIFSLFCAIDGKIKTAQAVLFDIALLLPF